MGVEEQPVGFVDTNVLVYAAARDDAARSPVAQELLERLSAAGALRVSAQVLQETFVTLTRKGRRPLSASEALIFLDLIAAHPVVNHTYGNIREAAEFSAAHRISFWDALIVVAAARSGAKILYSEDLQHGRTMLGVRIVNPFRRA